MATGSEPAPVRTPEGRRRQVLVMVGLLLSFSGFLLVSFELPLGAGQLERAVGVVGAGVVALWVGGILLGNVVRPMWRARSR